jgi:hypothetical protein
VRVGDVIQCELFGRGEIIGATYSGEYVVWWYQRCAITTAKAAGLIAAPKRAKERA